MLTLEGFDFALSEATRRAITDLGYENPTPIQEMTITPMLEGKDVIGQAQTGTGKTAAFGIPIVEKIDASEKYVQALVLSPTRELAVQTAGELVKLSKYHPGMQSVAVYGGAPIERQLRALKYGAQIVVGTPGRIMDHMRRGSLDISRIKICILDEADEMLDMGFRDDIEEILSQTNPDRQTALFSATMPLPIMNLGQKYLKNPELLKVQAQTLTVDAVKQTYIQIRPFHKNELLARLLVRDNIGRALVFMNTKLGVEDVVTNLQTRGFAAAGLHGDMRQIERDAIMERFKGGMINILVATDVAARGLDIENVEAVFNYDIPLDVEYYVHRIGRTGRAGKEGRAYTFVVGREISRIWDYRKITKALILNELPPSGEDIRSAEDARFMEKTAEIALSELDTAAAEKLLEGAEAIKIVAALLKQLEDAQGNRIHADMDIKIPEPPKPRPIAPMPAERKTTADRRPFAPYNRQDRPEKRHWDNKGKPAPFKKDQKPDKRSFYDPRQGSKPIQRHSGEVKGKHPREESKG